MLPSIQDEKMIGVCFIDTWEHVGAGEDRLSNLANYGDYSS